MDELRDPLQSICDGVDGALLATIIGVDGLPVDSVQTQKESAESLDVPALFVEYTSLMPQVQKSAQMFAAGLLEELAIRSENLVTIIRPINEEYFLALALLPSANSGKGRYLLRIHAAGLAKALS